jgi:TonB family protein
MPHLSQPLNPPTSPISFAATKNRADQSLRRGTGARAHFASLVSSRGGARCNVGDQREPLSDGRSVSLKVFLDASPTAKSFLPGSAQNVECDVTYSKQTSGEFLPGAGTRQCVSRTFARNARSGFRSAGVSPALLDFEFAPLPLTTHLSNRERELLESSLTHRKQTLASHSNRELSTNRRRNSSRSPRSLFCTNHSPLTTSHWSFLTGSAPQTKFDATLSKQTTEKFLTGSKTAFSTLVVSLYFSSERLSSAHSPRLPKGAAASALNASHSIGYNGTHMSSGSQGTQRAPVIPPSNELENSMEELPVHSRLPRLDLGVDWESPWQEFRSSVRDYFHGPRPTEGTDAPQNSHLQVQWVEGRLSRRAFAASFVWHVIVVTILLLPIWGFLASAEPTLPLPRIELTYVPTQDLRPISLPGNHPKPSPTGNPAKPLPRSGADAFHPRQTILSQPLKITHPRQTLIQPNAPAAPPKMVPQMPNIAEWAATSPEPAKPQLRIAPSVVAPQVHQRAVSDAAAPDVANPERNAGPLNIAPSPVANAQPKMPVNPMSNSAPERRSAHVDAGAAPVVGPTASAGDDSLHRLVAISAAPAPPAPEVSVPQGNLSSRVAISPEGGRSGAPGGSANGAAGNGGSGGTAASAGGAGTNAGANANSGPAGVSISGGNGHASSSGIGTSANRSGGLILKPMSNVPTLPDPSHKEPIVMGKIDPSLPPEKILSGKEVFTMRVDMPNLTSTSGSWILNFAQLDDNLPVYQRPKGKLAAPVALRKVDPKYPPSAIKQRIDGEVILYAIIRKDGRVDSIQLVRGLDPLLDQNAMDALARWEFRPASREGQPVDLEAVIHIPFQFRPKD